MWTDGLAGWYATNGRHHLPWRHTDDPWAVLVSEVMLQQTSVARVLPRWHAFMLRWPTAAACAAADQDEVLREWIGLGYPRRARALWLTAQSVAAGWPADLAGLQGLPGVGAYTARALLAFSSLGGPSGGSEPPRDVNLGRVAARAGLGLEPHESNPADLDAVLDAARPPGMSMREYGYALFDMGALHCRARPACTGCPAATVCPARRRTTPVAAAPPRQAAYVGSLRQLRGAVLAAALSTPQASAEQLAAAVSGLAGATPDRVADAIAGLVADGLVRTGGGAGRADGDGAADGTIASRQ